MSALGVAIICVLHLTGCATSPSECRSLERTASLREHLQEADKTHVGSAQSIALYLSTAESALAIATDKTTSPDDLAESIRIYNAAVSQCVLALQKLPPLPPGAPPRTFQADGKTYQLQIESTGASTKDPASFDRLIASGKISRKHLASDIQREGLGAAFVGVMNDSKKSEPNRPLGGFAEPLTAIATFQKARHGTTPVKLSLFDPRAKEKITLDHATFPLRGDFTAPLAYFPKTNNLLLGIAAMLRSDRAAQRSGIFFIEPYDPKKIPVLFVHGLMSSPQAWIEFINELNRDPEFRRRYQPWVFFYPSGSPIAANALRLRRDLDSLATQYPLKRNIVLVGHSMGGILSKMQVTNSGNILWDTVFGKAGPGVAALLPENSPFKRVLIFHANPYIARVIFIATPHLGSKLATLRISSIAGSLIRMPATVVRNFTPQMGSVLKKIDPSIRSIPSSIIGLSPKSPLLKGTSKLTIQVPYHSIIGNRGRDQEPLAKTSDGIVPYWSSHLDGAKSEIIVPTGHDAFDCPESVSELWRILALHAATLDKTGR